MIQFTVCNDIVTYRINQKKERRIKIGSIKFEEALKKFNEKSDNKNIIGTLGEKTLHAFLKYYIEPDCAFHEIKVGSYYADILNGKGIYEIQTKQFFKLRNKLKSFLKDYTVTLVCPLVYTKKLFWVSPETGETDKGRMSPRKGTFYDVYRELYSVKELLSDANLKLYIILLNIEEYRLLSGWSKDKKKGSECSDRIPVGIYNEIIVKDINDYALLIPDNLHLQFSSKDFAKEAHINILNARKALNILKYINVIKQVSKKGNLIFYERLI